MRQVLPRVPLGCRRVHRVQGARGGGARRIQVPPGQLRPLLPRPMPAGHPAAVRLPCDAVRASRVILRARSGSAQRPRTLPVIDSPTSLPRACRASSRSLPAASCGADLRSTHTCAHTHTSNPPSPNPLHTLQLTACLHDVRRLCFLPVSALCALHSIFAAELKLHAFCALEQVQHYALSAAL